MKTTKLVLKESTNALHKEFEERTKELLKVKQENKDIMCNLGFYPMEISKHKLVVTDHLNERRLVFDLHGTDKMFKHESVFGKEYINQTVPDAIAKVDKHSNKSFFDRTEVITIVNEKEELERIRRTEDPFLVGYREGQAYLITSWENHVWTQKNI